MAHHDHHDDKRANGVHPLHIGLFLFGGLCVGVGILNLYWSFGAPSGDLNLNVAQIGFSGLDDITTLPPVDYSIPLVVLGLLSLVYANAIAWRHTGGY